MHRELPAYTAIIGIDWADKKHDICVQALGSRERQFTKIPHQVDKIDEWAQLMVQRHGSPMAVALELSKGPIVSALQKYDCFVIVDPYPLPLLGDTDTV